MNSNSKNELAITACKVRMGVIEGTHCAKSGHPGGSLSVTDILTYLYFQEMKTDPQNPAWQERDRLVLSKGHTAPALYAVLAQKGFFPVEELKTLRKIGSRLQGHPDMKKIPGVDMSSGSLGQGISAACGMAKAAKLTGGEWRVYTVLGDGEIQEGQVWEEAITSWTTCVYWWTTTVFRLTATSRMLCPHIQSTKNLKPLVSTSSTSTDTILTRSRQP